MSSCCHTEPWEPGIKAEFEAHLRETPSRHRIAAAEADKIAQWLKGPHLKPASQAESSRRHYIRKNFAWDAKHGLLVRLSNATQTKKFRFVITEEKIIDTVKTVHEKNQHAGWDATWRDVSVNYHGILRSDVIFLLKRCMRCSGDPRKRPKSFLSGEGLRTSRDGGSGSFSNRHPLCLNLDDQPNECGGEVAHDEELMMVTQIEGNLEQDCLKLIHTGLNSS